MNGGSGMTRFEPIVIVGAGQGGLSVSYYLAKSGLPHVILDRGGIAHAWQAQRWDSFCLVTPNWTVNLPGRPYEGSDPDGFMPRDEFVAYLKEWAAGFAPPVQEGVEVTRIAGGAGDFRIETSAGPICTEIVVVATATFQHPKVPPFAGALPSRVTQLHAEDYKSPGQLPDGAVLVVGSGQTGGQVVEDMLRDGRRVFLSVGAAGRLPRRYRGRDCIAWQRDMGFLDRTPNMLESPTHRFVGDPHLTGRDRGASVSLHDFRRRGVTLLGQCAEVDGETVRFADTLVRDIGAADAFADDFMAKVDEYIASSGIDAPPPSADEMFGGPTTVDPPLEKIRTLDLAAAGIGSIVWATGFAFDFSWIDFPITDDLGYPITDDGATGVEGLYFCGLNWMTKRKSGILYGVGEDAEKVARHIQKRFWHSASQTSRREG